MSKLKVNNISPVTDGTTIVIGSHVDIGDPNTAAALETWGNITMSGSGILDMSKNTEAALRGNVLLQKNLTIEKNIDADALAEPPVQAYNATILDLNTTNRHISIGRDYVNESALVNIYSDTEHQVSKPKILNLTSAQSDVGNFDNPNLYWKQFSKLIVVAATPVTPGVTEYFSLPLTANSIYHIELTMLFKYITSTDSSPVISGAAIYKIGTDIYCQSGTTFSKFGTDINLLYNNNNIALDDFTTHTVGSPPAYIAPSFSVSGSNLLIQSGSIPQITANKKLFCTGNLQITEIKGLGA